MRNLVTHTASALLVLLCAGGATAKHSLQGQSQGELLSMGSKTPIVSQMEYSKYFETDKYGGFGIGWDFEFDVDLGYAFPVEYFFTNIDNLLFNPQLYVEVASHSYMDLIFPMIEYRFRFDFVGYKYTILDYVFLWNLHNLNEHCSGMSWIQNLFTFEINLETNVNECDFGFVNYFVDSSAKDTVYENCKWKRYTLD
jgi:hypothetical protein